MVRVGALEACGRVILVQFPSRMVLAGSVLGMFVASTGVALLMPERASGTATPAPELTTASTEAQALPPAESAAEVAPASAAAPPPITGAQIAALAIGPARERAAALIAEQARARAAAEADAAAKAAQESRNDQVGSAGHGDVDDWIKLRNQIRDACDDGRIRGPICGD
jgi:hypothetical protein